jgi:hypothetical protein
MAWYDVRIKQRDVIEFLMTEKGSITNIHKRLKNVYSVNAVDKSTVSVWASRTAGSERGQAESSTTRVALVSQRQQSGAASTCL